MVDLEELELYGSYGTLICACIFQNLQIFLVDIQYVEFRNLKMHNIDD